MIAPSTAHLITLGQIRDQRPRPCEDGWRKLCKTLGTSADDTALSIGDIAKSNGAADAYWTLRCIDDPRTRVAAVMPSVRRAVGRAGGPAAHACVVAIDRWLAGDDGVDLTTAEAEAWGVPEWAGGD